MVKKKNVYNLIIFFTTMLIVLTNSVSNSMFFQEMFIFELVYLLCSTVFFLLPEKSFNLPCMIFRITAFIRYVILPVLVYKEGEVRYYFEFQVRMIMIIEIIMVHVIILFYYQSKLYRKKIRANEISINTSNPDIIPMRLGLMTIAVAVIGMLVLLQNPMLLTNYFVFSFSKKSVSGLSGGGAILLQISILFALIYLLTIVKKNRFFPDSIKILISFILVVIYANGKGVTAENVSRWGVLVSIITGIVFIFSLYPKAKKTVSVLTFLIVPLVVLSSTLLKQEMWGSTSSGIENVLSVSSINGYFSGSLNIEKGLALLDSVNIDKSKTLFQDTFANFPMLNHLIDTSETTATHFNQVFYGSNIARDQICPMIIQFKEYFGVFGFIAYGIIVFLGLHFHTISTTKRILLEKNIFIILTFYFSLVFCLNWSILLEVIWIQVLPLLLVNYFNIKVKSRGAKSE